MKKRILNMLFLGLLSFSTLYAKETYKTHPHHLYFGPECLELKLNTHVKDLQIEGKKSLAGFRLGYEYINPWAFYAGVDLLSTICSHGFHAKENNEPIHSNDQATGFGNLDLRFGYTIAPNKSTYIPFLGLGSYSIGSVDRNRGFHEGWLYLSSGLRALFAVNDVFSMGVNLKAYKAIVAYTEFQNHDFTVKGYCYPWGGEIGIPFVWSFNPAKTWTFQLEPYWIKLNFSQNQEVVGSKFLITAHF
jgi:hypothetical protein